MTRAEDPCRCLSQQEVAAQCRRQALCHPSENPHTGTTTFSDASFGEITVENSTLDDQVLMKRDGLPTYNFANVIDDHLMGITHVVRGSEYLSSSPKYNLLYEAFGWEIPTYIHCSPVMRDAQHKMSKRHGDPSYEDLKAQGYLTEAILNYVALLGWSPRGELAEQEFFTLEELVQAFDITGISKSPAIFDLEKLNYFNSAYLKALSPEAFLAVAEPYLKQGITNPSIDLRLVAPLVQTRLNTLTEIPPMVDFFDRLPEYSNTLYLHKENENQRGELAGGPPAGGTGLPGHDRVVLPGHPRRPSPPGRGPGSEKWPDHVAGSRGCLRQSHHPRRRGGAVPHLGQGGDPAPGPAGHPAADSAGMSCRFSMRPNGSLCSRKTR